MKNLLILTLILAASTAGFSQEQPEPVKNDGFDKSRLFFGGNFGLSFGSNLTLINISPQVGYRFTETFAAGAGVNFISSSFKDSYSKTSQTYAGLNIFGRVYPIRQILLQAQPELNYSWGKYKEYGSGYTYNLEGKFVPSLILGAGAAIPTGSGAFIIMAQYDVIQDPRTPYGKNVFYNFGYNFGF